MPNPFVVNTFKLKQRYLEAQKICHPDGWATHGAVRVSVGGIYILRILMVIQKESHNIAQGLSHHIGLAWSTLKDPLPRAEYILKLHDIEIAEEDQLEDFELISEILEVREELENATPSKVQQILDKNHGKWGRQ